MAFSSACDNCERHWLYIEEGTDLFGIYTQDAQQLQEVHYQRLGHALQYELAISPFPAEWIAVDRCLRRGVELFEALVLEGYYGVFQLSLVSISSSSSVCMRTRRISPKQRYIPSRGGSGGCRLRSSGGRSRSRAGNEVAGSVVLVADEGCAARREDMRSRFSGVKCWKNGGGAGNAESDGGGCCSSAIVFGSCAEQLRIHSKCVSSEAPQVHATSDLVINQSRFRLGDAMNSLMLRKQALGRVLHELIPGSSTSVDHIRPFYYTPSFCDTLYLFCILSMFRL